QARPSGGREASPAPFLVLGDLLLDRPEDAVVALVIHPDTHRIALFHKGGLGFAVKDRLDGPHLGEATIAEPALGDRLARPSARVAVRHGARADDRPGPEVAGLCRVRDESAKVEGH